MSKAKYIVILFFVVLGFQKTYSQTYTFKTSGMSVLQKNPKGSWGEWPSLILVEMMVKLDTNKNRIVVYSEMIQAFEIVEYIPLQENESDSNYSFICKDNNGENCTLSIITRKNQNNRKQLYITFEDRIVLYNIFNYP